MGAKPVVRLANKLDVYDIHWFEEPVPLYVPDRPGLGVDLVPEVLAEYEVTAEDAGS